MNRGYRGIELVLFLKFFFFFFQSRWTERCNLPLATSTQKEDDQRWLVMVKGKMVMVVGERERERESGRDEE